MVVAYVVPDKVLLFEIGSGNTVLRFLTTLRFSDVPLNYSFWSIFPKFEKVAVWYWKPLTSPPLKDDLLTSLLLPEGM